ncbi:hypothetical protein EV385_6637 [Krasilnikovia cinnamomea]|uniref:Uncharacterized protein n=1 Tax=Krasilnikovia cinnamomea TaxID=349313 RepID=A0A4Q7Z9M5_9ACTN|nr:hypothetical protein [Krasilnikovia cinnamomea]RZU46563.1 hypothetical protein EV385_6637 [Krasilnikovia cinnamomea]
MTADAHHHTAAAHGAEQVAQEPVAPTALRARYARLRAFADAHLGDPAEQAVARQRMEDLESRYPDIAEAPEPARIDPCSEDARSWGHVDIPGSAGLGRIRTEIAIAVIRAHDVDTTRVDWRHRDGDTRLAFYGLRPVVEHLTASLPGVLQRLDAAALAATRRYRAWLREGDDSEPAWHASMCRWWRRDYLASAGAAYAAELRQLGRPRELTAGPQQSAPATMGHHNAYEIAGQDVRLLDQAPRRAAHAVVMATQAAIAAHRRRPVTGHPRQPALEQPPRRGLATTTPPAGPGEDADGPPGLPQQARV